MSNEETLQEYNTRLEENNTSLANVLTTINNLPSSSSGSSSEIYSVEETMTNRVWTDGKPIYRKVFSGAFGTITNGTYTNVEFDTTSLSVDKTISLDGAITDTSGNIWTLNTYSQNTTPTIYSYLGSNKKITTRSNSSTLSKANVIVVFEYTKK